MDGELKELLDFCQEYDMLPKGGTVIACVSGGADSMCLLHMLRAVAPDIGFTLHAAHFNHNLRGDESDGDEAFVKARCAALGVPLHIGSGDVRSEAKKRRLGIEETARLLRYAFFQELSEKLSGARIATAHSADDELETVLLRLTRGTGLLGLGGIPPVRGNVIRPLLPLTRVRIETYLERHGIPHREDTSNLSDDYGRNKLRHHVIPVLRELNPGVSEASVRMAALLRRDEDYLASQAEKFLAEGAPVSASRLAALPTPIASRVVRRMAGPGLSSHQVDAVLRLTRSEDPSASVSLPGVTIRREYDQLLLGDAQKRSFEPKTLFGPEGRLEIPELSLRIRWEETVAGCEIYNSLTTFLIKCDNMKGELVVRPRREGDSIRLSEKSGRKTLKKLFIEKKIPAQDRSAIPLLCDDTGVLAVFGLGQDVRTVGTKGECVIKVQIEEIKIYD